MDLGVENDGAEEVVAVTVPAVDADEAVRMMRLLASSLTPEENRARSARWAEAVHRSIGAAAGMIWISNR